VAGERLSHERALELFRRISDLHDEHDSAGVRTAFTEDAVYEDDGAPEPVRGHAELERFFSGVWRAFPDFRVELLEGPYLSEDGSGFAVLGRISGTMTGPLDPPGLAPTGTRIEAEFAGFYEPGGNRIRRGRIVMNVNDFATQLGAAPKPGSGGERLGVLLQRLQARRTRRRAI
jgi:SnoaL-like protein